MIELTHLSMTTEKAIVLTIRTFVGKVMSLLYTMLSRFDIGFPGGSVVKNPPAMWETWVRSLGWEDPLEEGMATHSSILTWRIPWTEEPGRVQSVGREESDMIERLSTAHIAFM